MCCVAEKEKCRGKILFDFALNKIMGAPHRGVDLAVADPGRLRLNSNGKLAASGCGSRNYCLPHEPRVLLGTACNLKLFLSHSVRYASRMCYFFYVQHWQDCEVYRQTG